jgi:hypothetical protein
LPDSLRVTRPHIYGDEKKARAALARQIARGEELLSRAGGVQKRIDQAKAKAKAKTRPKASPSPKSRPRTAQESLLGLRLTLRPLTPVDDEFIAGEWIRDVDKWSERTRRVMRDYLEDQFVDVMPTVAEGLPYKTSMLDGGSTWLRKAIDELQQVQAALGVQRAYCAVTACADAICRAARVGGWSTPGSSTTTPRAWRPRCARRDSSATRSARPRS